jgi:hypothetical protein
MKRKITVIMGLVALIAVFMLVLGVLFTAVGIAGFFDENSQVTEVS